MNSFLRKPLFNLFAISVVSVLLTAAAQAASFNKLMNLGVIKSDSLEKEVVIYNDDYTKCLSANGLGSNSSKNLDFTTCRLDDSDTWSITSAGKIKNKQNGKCLSTPKGEDKLVLVHCNFVYFRDYIAHDFIIFDRIIDDDRDAAEVAEVRY